MGTSATVVGAGRVGTVVVVVVETVLVVTVGADGTTVGVVRACVSFLF